MAKESKKQQLFTSFNLILPARLQCLRYPKSMEKRDALIERVDEFAALQREHYKLPADQNPTYDQEIKLRYYLGVKGWTLEQIVESVWPEGAAKYTPVGKPEGPTVARNYKAPVETCPVTVLDPSTYTAPETKAPVRTGGGNQEPEVREAIRNLAVRKMGKAAQANVLRQPRKRPGETAHFTRASLFGAIVKFALDEGREPRWNERSTVPGFSCQWNSVYATSLSALNKEKKFSYSKGFHRIFDDGVAELAEGIKRKEGQLPAADRWLGEPHPPEATFGRMLEVMTKRHQCRHTSADQFYVAMGLKEASAVDETAQPALSTNPNLPPLTGKTCFAAQVQFIVANRREPVSNEPGYAPGLDRKWTSVYVVMAKAVQGKVKQGIHGRVLQKNFEDGFIALAQAAQEADPERKLPTNREQPLGPDFPGATYGHVEDALQARFFRRDANLTAFYVRRGLMPASALNGSEPKRPRKAFRSSGKRLDDIYGPSPVFSAREIRTPADAWRACLATVAAVQMWPHVHSTVARAQEWKRFGYDGFDGLLLSHIGAVLMGPEGKTLTQQSRELFAPDVNDKATYGDVYTACFVVSAARSRQKFQGLLEYAEKHQNGRRRENGAAASNGAAAPNGSRAVLA